MFIIGNAAVCGDLFLADGAILIEGNKISAIGRTSELRAEHPDCDYIDAGGRIMLPGLVNAHNHLYSFFSPGITPHGVSGTFNQILQNLWWPLDDVLDEETVYYSALMGALDSLAHGVTALFDHHASMSFVRGSLEAVRKGIETAGLRGVLCFETSERAGKDKIDSHIGENISFYERNKDNPFFKGMFGLHANMTLSDSALSAVRSAIPCGMPVHIHCGESFEDFAFCVNLGYGGAVDRLSASGLVTENSILAHCVHVSSRDLEIIRDIKPFVVTNAESNANNRAGSFNRAALPLHVLGTDGITGDIIATLRSYYLLGEGGREPFERLAQVFFRSQRDLLPCFFPQCIGLAAGAAADICVLEYRPFSPIDSNNVLGHLLFGAKGGKAWLTAVDGKILWRNGEFQSRIDIERLTSDARTAAAKLHERFYKRGRYFAQ